MENAIKNIQSYPEANIHSDHVPLLAEIRIQLNKKETQTEMKKINIHQTNRATGTEVQRGTKSSLGRPEQEFVEHQRMTKRTDGRDNRSSREVATT